MPTWTISGRRSHQGYKLDRYELLCPIAQGGMAEVWMARQTGKHGFEKMVAVKTILPKFADDDGFQRMFLDEAQRSRRASSTRTSPRSSTSASTTTSPTW